MKAFNKLQSVAHNIPQLMQFLSDAKQELDNKEKTRAEIGEFFNSIYSLNLRYWEQQRLARYIKSGKWRT